MIDEQWFAAVRCLTGAPIPDGDAAKLADVLGVEEEVLPYLLLRTTAFADWPHAREAFRQSIRSVVRPKLAGRAAAGSRPNDAARIAFAAAAIARMDGTDPQGSPAVLLQQTRLAHSKGCGDPHVFIASAEPAHVEKKAD